MPYRIELTEKQIRTLEKLVSIEVINYLDRWPKETRYDLIRIQKQIQRKLERSERVN